METIKIAQWAQINTLYLPVYIAMECGLFAAKGIEAKLILAGNDDDIIDAVRSGKAHFGLGDPTFCAMKKYQKNPCRVLLAIGQRAVMYGLTKDPSRPEIISISDLVNTRITCFPKPSTTYSLIAELKTGYKRLLKSLQIIESPIGEQFDTLARGEADMIVDIEPFISIAENKGYRVIYSFAKAHGPYAMTGFFTRQELIETNPTLVQKSTSAIIKAIDILLNDPKTALEVSQKIFPQLPLAVHQASLQRLRQDNAWPQDGLFSRVAWEKAITTRENIGDKFMEDVFLAVDDRFARKTA